MQEDIQKLNDEITRLKENAGVKSEMVSIGTHQIRTSLSAIKWMIKMFLDGDLGTLTVEQETILKKAFDNNDRAIAIINEILLLNKTEDITEKAYKFENVDAIELIENVTFDFSGEAHGQKVEVIFLKPYEDMPNVYADKEKLRIVLDNLLENAIKYNNAGGKIFIALEKNAEDLEISFKDTGIGISEEGKDKIFEKFYREPNAEKKEVVGSGIGLFTVKKIVENMKGKIWFDSSEGNGTTFFFTLPMAK